MIFINGKTLNTPRLQLASFRFRDIASVFDLCSRPETSQYSLWEPHKNYWDSFKYLFFVKYLSGGIHWSAKEKESGRIIGSCSFVWVDSTSGEAEIGYSIHPDFWHNGFGTELVLALLKYGFEELDLCKISARIMPQNIRSLALAERVGFNRVEKEAKYVMDGDIRREIVHLEITLPQYHESHQKN